MLAIVVRGILDFRISKILTNALNHHCETSTMNFAKDSFVSLPGTTSGSINIGISTSKTTMKRRAMAFNAITFTFLSILRWCNQQPQL